MEELMDTNELKDPATFDPRRYSDVHRRMLQILISRGCIPSAKGKLLFKKALELSEYDPELIEKLPGLEMRRLLNDSLALIEARVTDIGFGVKTVKNERGNGQQSYICLVNTRTSELTKLCSTQTTAESEWLKIFLRELSECKDGKLGMVVATGLANQVPNLPQKLKPPQVRELIERLARDHWLQDAEGYVWATPRLIAELNIYLRETLQLDPCIVCNEVVFYKKDQECSECDTRAHSYCVKADENGDRKCPGKNCNALW